MNDITHTRSSLYRTAHPHLRPTLTPVRHLDTLACSLLIGSIWDSSNSEIRVTHHIAYTSLLSSILHVTTQGSRIASCHFQPLYKSHVIVPFCSHRILLRACEAAFDRVSDVCKALFERSLRATQLRAEDDAKKIMTKIVAIVAKNPSRAKIDSLVQPDGTGWSGRTLGGAISSSSRACKGWGWECLAIRR
jgi:hypothetical protein